MTWQILCMISVRGRLLQLDAIIKNGSSMSDTIVMSTDVKFEGQHLTNFTPAIQGEVRVVIMTLEIYHLKY